MPPRLSLRSPFIFYTEKKTAALVNDNRIEVHSRADPNGPKPILGSHQINLRGTFQFPPQFISFLSIPMLSEAVSELIEIRIYEPFEDCHPIKLIRFLRYYECVEICL